MILVEKDDDGDVRVATDPSIDEARQVARLDEALALVRGDPFADMPYAEFLQEEIRRLDELIAAAHELRAELALATDDAIAWMPRPTALVER